jgi:hypothetical protein
MFDSSSYLIFVAFIESVDIKCYVFVLSKAVNDFTEVIPKCRNSPAVLLDGARTVLRELTAKPREAA